MNRENKKKIDRWIYIKFVVLIFVGFIIGGLCGFGGAYFADIFYEGVSGGVEKIMKVCIPIIYVCLMLVSHGFCFYNYFKAKKLATKWDGWNEDIIEEAEKRLGAAVDLTNIMTVCNFFFYSVMLFICEINESGIEKRLPLIIFSLIFFEFNIVIMIILQKKLVDLTKKLNPEKEGNIFDTKFNKVWLESCDEGQKQLIFEAGYKAMKVTTYVCMAMWLFTLLAVLLFDTGILPSLCVFVIWLTLVLSYTIACRKHKNKK